MSMQLFWARSAAVIVAVTGLLASSAPAADGWLVSFQAAKEQAAKEGKDILIEFTGSDWCPPCKALKSAVLDSDVFKEKAPEKFILLKVDNPRDKSMQTEEEKEQYPKMSAEFKVTGVPTIILADAQGRPYTKMVGYGGQKADEYVANLTSKEGDRKKRDEALAKADKASGADRAKLLDEALACVDSELAIAQYRGLVDEIVKLDADNKAGLKEKYEATIKLGDIRAALTEIRQEVGKSRSFDGVPEKIDAVVEKFKPTGEGLQEVLIMKGSAYMQMGKKPEAKETLEAALKAAPKTQMAQQIERALAVSFKDLDAKPAEDGKAKGGESK